LTEPGPGARRAPRRRADETPAPAPVPPVDDRRKIAIACQGGGSHTAFTAGVLKVLLEQRVHERFRLVSISGTSGGAICAALAWDGIVRGAARPWEGLVAFWEENTAQGPIEQGLNDAMVATMRKISGGLLPQWAVAPGSPMLKALMSFTSLGMRPRYTDFLALLQAHIDFDAWRGLGLRAQPPVLVIGAVNVLNGKLRRFSSAREVIRPEHILASCAVPNLFEAVELDGGAYWDGLFSDNPPITELPQAAFVGSELLPPEIWVIKINPTTSDSVPATPEEISNRRNELIGNMSMFHQLESLAWLNDLFLRGAFKTEFLDKFLIKEPVLIPKGYPDAADRPYHIPYIEISEALRPSLSYETKLDRGPANIARLMADGERQALRFLEARGLP